MKIYRCLLCGVELKTMRDGITHAKTIHVLSKNAHEMIIEREEGDLV